MNISRFFSFIMVFSVLFTLSGCGEGENIKQDINIELSYEQPVDAVSLKVPTELKRQNVVLRSFNDGYRIFTVEREALNPKFGNSETVELIVYDVNNQRVAAYKHLNLTNGWVHDAIFRDEILYYSVDTSNYHVVYKIDGINTVEVIKEAHHFTLYENDDGVCFSYTILNGEKFETVKNIITDTGYNEISRENSTGKVEKHNSSIEGGNIIAVLDDYYVVTTYNRDTDECKNYIEYRESGKNEVFGDYRIPVYGTDESSIVVYQVTGTEQINRKINNGEITDFVDKQINILKTVENNIKITPVETGLKLSDFDLQCKADEGKVILFMTTAKKTGNKMFIYK